MAAEGLDYEHVLAEAQDLGVAEADPTFDVDGTDAALKFVILANVLADGGDTRGRDGRRDSVDSGQRARSRGRGRPHDSAHREATRDGIPRRSATRPENGALAVTGTRNIVQIETRTRDRSLERPRCRRPGDGSGPLRRRSTAVAVAAVRSALFYSSH